MNDDNSEPRLTVRVMATDGDGSELFVAVSPEIMSRWLALDPTERAALLAAMADAANEAAWRIANVILAGV